MNVDPFRTFLISEPNNHNETSSSNNNNNNNMTTPTKVISHDMIGDSQCADAEHRTAEARNADCYLDDYGASGQDEFELLMSSSEDSRELPSYDEYEDEDKYDEDDDDVYDEMLSTTISSSTEELIFVNGQYQKERDVVFEPRAFLHEDPRDAPRTYCGSGSSSSSEVRGTPFLLTRSLAWSQDSLDQSAFRRAEPQEQHFKGSTNNASWSRSPRTPTLIHWEEKVTDSSNIALPNLLQHAIDLVDEHQPF